MCRAHNNNTAASSLGKGGSAVNSPLGTSQTSLCSPPSSLLFAQSPPASRAFLCGRLPSLPSRTPWSFSSPPSQPLSPPMFSPHRPHGSRPLSGVQSSSFSSSAQKLQSGVEEKGGVGVSTIRQAQRSLSPPRLIAASGRAEDNSPLPAVLATILVELLTVVSDATFRIRRTIEMNFITIGL